MNFYASIWKVQKNARKLLLFENYRKIQKIKLKNPILLQKPK